jgi:hypothetical protein
MGNSFSATKTGYETKICTQRQTSEDSKDCFDTVVSYSDLMENTDAYHYDSIVSNVSIHDANMV